MSPFDPMLLDTTIHGPVRLGVLAALQVDSMLDFTTLKKRLGVSDGALGLHLKKLETAGYISSSKAFVGRRPRTTYKLVAKGQRAFAAYLDQMQELLDTVQNAVGRDLL